MTDPTPVGLWDRVAQIVAEKTGLHFSPERRGDLERGITAAMSELGCSAIEDCLEWLTTAALSQRHIEVLAERLTIGETYFFRDKALHNALRTGVLSDLIGKRSAASKSLRIWSAGCCTGEEPYSIAILLRDMIPDLSNWNITLLATDINRRFLNAALNGSYTQWSFRETAPKIMERYFRKAGGGRFILAQEIRRMVEFSILNLVEDTYPSVMNNTNAMDIILCRNVLMYFTPEQAVEVVRRFHRSIVDGGWLIVSPAETSHVMSLMFQVIESNGIILYRKGPQPVWLEEVVREQIVIPAGTSRLEPPPSGFFPENAPQASPSPPAPPLPAMESEPHEEAEEPVNSLEEAAALFNAGAYGLAVEKLVLVLSRGDETAEAMTLLSRSYANQGFLAEARMWCERAIAADKLNAGHYHLLGAILQEQGETDYAERIFNQALYLEPRSVLASFALGNLARARGNAEAAGKHFNNTLEFLVSYKAEDILPWSGGMTAGRLTEIIRVFIER